MPWYLKRTYLDGLHQEFAGDGEGHGAGTGAYSHESVPGSGDLASSVPGTRRTVDTGQQVIDLAAMKAELEDRRANGV